MLKKKKKRKSGISFSFFNMPFVWMFANKCDKWECTYSKIKCLWFCVKAQMMWSNCLRFLPRLTGCRKRSSGSGSGSGWLAAENSADRKVLHFVTLLIFLWQISLNTDFCSEWNLTAVWFLDLFSSSSCSSGVCVCVCVYVCVWCSLSERCWFRVCVCVYTGHWRRCYRAAAVLSLVSAEWCLWVAWPARWWVGTGAEPLVLHGGGAVLVRAAAAQGLTMPLAAVLLLSAATLVSKDRGHFFLSLWALSLLVVLCHFFLCGLCHLLVVLVTSFFVGFVFACRPGHFFLCALCLLLVVLVTSFFVGFVLALNQIYSFVVIIGSTNKYRKHKSNRCLFECYL